MVMLWTIPDLYFSDCSDWTNGNFRRNMDFRERRICNSIPGRKLLLDDVCAGFCSDGLPVPGTKRERNPERSWNFGAYQYFYDDAGNILDGNVVYGTGNLFTGFDWRMCQRNFWRKKAFTGENWCDAASGCTHAYPTIQARCTVANASFAGTGSLGTFQTRSGAYSDYIINCTLSYFGIGVVLLLLVVLTLFLLRVFHISVRQKKQLGFLLGIASCSILVLKSLCYVGANFGVLPGSAVDMPLLSYGLNNTIANAVMIGLVLSVYRYTKVFDREPLDSGAGGNCGFTLLHNGKSRV